MTAVWFHRRTLLALAGTAAICLGTVEVAKGQYRTSRGCAMPSDCTAPGAAIAPSMAPPMAPTEQGEIPLQPGAPESAAPSLAPEQFASLGGATIGLAQDNLGAAPNTIGDFFAGGCTMATLIRESISVPVVRDPKDPNQPDVIFQEDVFEVCIPTPGSAIGRMKLADNNSPLPRDRVFFDYNYFHNTSLNGVDVNRYTPGFEKTFLDGVGSLEFRVPMAGTLDNNIVIDPLTGADQTGLDGEFGDLFFALKFLLVAGDRGAVSAGVGLTAPTASDVHVNLNDGTQLALVENEAVYVSPFAGFLVTPSSDTFLQGFVQLNFDGSGNPVFADIDGAGLLPLGRLNEQSTLFLDLSLGRWIYRDPSGPRGLAAVIEAHYATTIQDADVITSGLLRVGDPTFNADVLNLTIGAHALVGQTVFTIGFGAPVTDDRAFDAELRAFINRYF